jgi:hypothetical protein
MLSYRCTNACRHCLYRCSPDWSDDWMSLELAERTFAALAREPRLRSVHLAGGEPGMRLDLLEEVLRIASAEGVRLSYVETNASWCADRGETRRRFERLRDAGLPAVLVSVSPFHCEYVPFSSTRNCVEEASKVLDVFVYMPHIYEVLSRMPGEGTHTLKEFCDFIGIPVDSPGLPDLYGLIPGGRVPRALGACYPRRPASVFRGRSCGEKLFSTTHFHVDCYGSLFTGYCAGLSPATVDDLHPEITPETHPVFSTLAAGGPWALAEMAAERCGFEPREGGYIGKCDLCLDARGCLAGTGDYPELRPAEYYRH